MTHSAPDKKHVHNVQKKKIKITTTRTVMIMMIMIMIVNPKSPFKSSYSTTFF